MSSLYLIGFIQTLFLSVLIVSKKRFRLSDLWLTVFILLMGTRLFFIYLTEIRLYEDNPSLIIMEFAYWSLFGPVLFLYISTVTAKTQKFKTVYLLHFIPALTVFLAFSGYIFDPEKVPFSEYNFSGFLYQVGKYTWFFTTHIYFIFCLIKLHRYRARMKTYFSYKKKINLQWLLVLTYGFAFYLFYMLTYILLREYTDVQIPVFGDHLIWLIMVLYIFLIGIFGFRQRDVFMGQAGNRRTLISEDENVVMEDRSSPKYARSKLDETEAGRILETVLDYMQNKKPYLNCELDIRMLGEHLNLAPHKISQVINTRLNQNFFEFVNHYRVEHVKELLKDPENTRLKIMAVGFDAGFNSKSTFYTIFKKYTQQTPTEYREKVIST